MARLFKTKQERKKSLWKRAVDLALTDVRVLAGRMDHETLESLEEKLIGADFGVRTSLRLVDAVETAVRRGKARDGTAIREALREEVREILESDDVEMELQAAETPPTVYLIAGVNGVGKTTTVAKLANLLHAEGQSVLLAAGDTYRAGAVEQLRMWAERIGVDFVAGQQGGDPAAVAFDAMEAGLSRKSDVILIDTAGRLHTNRGLMAELGKVDRVVRRKLDGAPHETLMVLDATIGQNALQQVKAFGQVLDLTGVALTKMDSTARGGIVVALREEYGLPVKLVGTGEQLDDLQPFDVESFLEGVFAED
ncbi:MAG TPA: signal recognition particle-docking protein FtsY [Longimicrobiales bacterium]|nr:signal recognition particle-docking protein FtsY [Longimicrobiales bacterium]